MVNKSFILLLLLGLVGACGDDSATDSALLCTEPEAADSDQAVSLYIEAWSERDPDLRACLFQQGLAAGATLIDSTGELFGELEVRDRLGSAASSIVERDLTRQTLGEIEVRHQEAMLHWALVDRTGAVAETGEDWLEFAPDGTITWVHRISGRGSALPISAELLAWERAWNAQDSAERGEALRVASTDDVRFTDLIVDVQGRQALADEIERQLAALDYRLSLSDTIEVFARVAGEPRLVRHSARIVFDGGNGIDLVNYVRLDGDRIERLTGFPAEPR